MKANGLSSTNRAFLKKVSRQKSFASHQESHLAAKEKQKSLRLQAAKAENDRRLRELEKQADLDAV
jgi:hypothetical protein